MHSQTQSVKKLLECILTGNSKLYLDKAYTEDQLDKLNEDEVEKLFNNYKAKLSGQMVKLLGCSIINMYSMGACAALGITSQDALSEDIENDPFLNCAVQRFTCELYYRFGLLLAPLSTGIIMSRHYLWGRCVTPVPQGPLSIIKMEEQVETMKAPQVEITKNLWGRTATPGPAGPLTSSKSEGPMGPASRVIGSFIGMGTVGFSFGFGAILAIKMVNNLEELIKR